MAKYWRTGRNAIKSRAAEFGRLVGGGGGGGGVGGSQSV